MPRYVWPTDRNGNLINLGNSSFQGTFLPIIEDVKGEIFPLVRSSWLLAVRGSVAIGAAVPPFSDLDLILIVDDLVAEEDRSALERARAKIQLAYADRLDLVELQLVDRTRSSRELSRAVAHLQLQSVTLTGHALQYPPLRPDLDLYYRLWEGTRSACRSIAQNVKVADLSWNTEPKPASFWCRWVLRDVIRMTCGVAMLRTKLYSSHLDSCVELISDALPPLAPTARALLSAERFPPVSREECLTAMSDGLGMLDHALAWNSDSSDDTMRIDPDRT